MEQKKILVVDDDSLFRDSILEILRRRGYDLTAAKNGPEALIKFAEDTFDLVISDMKMPQMSGVQLLEKIRQSDTEVPFLIITAFGDVETAVHAMKKGANDYLQKSDSLPVELEMTVERLLEYRGLVKENKQLRSALKGQWNYIGESDCLSAVRTLVEKIADSKSTVLITGESGTGKELIARSIHYQSRRANGPFVKINCAALPEGLIESELFGHEKGAFTGAIKRRLGKFELAHGGTLLLDEIGELPSGVQAKLLRVLQEHEIDNVGGETPVAVDVRIIATTNRDLESEVAAGNFREDLYYRLNVFHIQLPPLRERKSDIPLLANFFVQRFNNENGFSVDVLTAEALAVLGEHAWQGNIRELENTIERAVVLARSGSIDPSLLALRARKSLGTDGDHGIVKPGMTIALAEKELILATLNACGNNRTKTAAMLDISIRTLRNKLHEYAVVLGDDEVEDLA